MTSGASKSLYLPRQLKQKMDFIDIILGILLISGFIKGIRNGFFVELASLLSILLGILIAIKFSYLMKEYLSSHGSWNPKTIQVAAFALTFILVVVAVSALAKILTGIANFASLGIFNKLLGGIFGVLKIILMISVVLNLFEKINSGHTFADKKTLDSSKLYHPVRAVSQRIYPSIEDWFTAFKSGEFKLEKHEENR